MRKGSLISIGLACVCAVASHATTIAEFTFDAHVGYSQAWTLDPLSADIGPATISGQIPVIGEDYWNVLFLGTAAVLNANYCLDGTYFEIDVNLSSYSAGYLQFKFDGMISSPVADSQWAVSYSTDGGASYVSWGLFSASSTMATHTLDASSISGGLLGGPLLVRVTHQRTASQLVEAWFDNITLEVVPEPEPFVLCLLGAAALFASKHVLRQRARC